MNEVKISTQVKSNNNQKLAIKLDLQSLGLDWSNDTFVRVRSYKKLGKIVLEKVSNKYNKQVTYKITDTAGGNSSHQKGIYVTQKNKRFNKIAASKVVSAAARLNNNKIEIYLPDEIFA